MEFRNDWICIHCHREERRRTQVMTAVRTIRGEVEEEPGALSVVEGGKR